MKKFCFFIMAIPVMFILFGALLIVSVFPFVGFDFHRPIMAAIWWVADRLDL